MFRYRSVNEHAAVPHRRGSKSHWPATKTRTNPRFPLKQPETEKSNFAFDVWFNRKRGMLGKIINKWIIVTYQSVSCHQHHTRLQSSLCCLTKLRQKHVVSKQLHVPVTTVIMKRPPRSTRAGPSTCGRCRVSVHSNCHVCLGPFPLLYYLTYSSYFTENCGFFFVFLTVSSTSSHHSSSVFYVSYCGKHLIKPVLTPRHRAPALCAKSCMREEKGDVGKWRGERGREAVCCLTLQPQSQQETDGHCVLKPRPRTQ